MCFLEEAMLFASGKGEHVLYAAPPRGGVASIPPTKEIVRDLLKQAIAGNCNKYMADVNGPWNKLAETAEKLGRDYDGYVVEREELINGANMAYS